MDYRPHQTQTQPIARSRAAGICAIEALKNFFLFGRRNAGTAVTDAYTAKARLDGNGQADITPLRCVLDGVINKIGSAWNSISLSAKIETGDRTFTDKC